MKMTKEEFVEKISKLELSEDRAISKLVPPDEFPFDIRALWNLH
jgi:hypothetical protein